ncbi:MAG: hypothetical protein ACI849_001024 [Patiriisocius sp.]|jgi:hypothetical protein
MNKTIFTLLLLVISFSISNAQGLTDISLMKINDAAAKDEGSIDFDNPNTYIGTPYSNPKFVLGSILRNDTVIFNMVALRYNAISDQIEIKETLITPNEEIRNLKKSAALVAKMGDTKFIFMPFDGSISEGDFLEVIYKGTQVDVFKKHVKDIRYPIKASSSITRDTPAKFSDKPLYFLVTKRQQFYQFPKSRKKKFKVFGEKEKLMKQYAKEEKLDINTEEDLIAIVAHFEKL